MIRIIFAAMSQTLDWPLMRNNITRADLDELVAYLKADEPRLTNGPQVEAFEEEWSRWLGVRHSVMVSSGSAANLITMAVLRETVGTGDVIVSPLTWVSNIAAVLHTGFTPVFADIDLRTLGMDTDAILAKVTQTTKAVFMTHVLGYNGLTDRLLGATGRGVTLLEDVCESHGATHHGAKLGTFGEMSNFSFYYAHHMSTIEGGMVCTNSTDTYELLRMFRAHGLVREAKSAEVRTRYAQASPDLDPQFIFPFAAYNMRPTELQAVLGRAQLRRLDANNEKRCQNLRLFLDTLDSKKYRTDFLFEGSSNYAFTLVLKEPDDVLVERVMALLREQKVEYRRGTAGGGNQLRQPYLQSRVAKDEHARYPNVEHVHFYGFYIGNYPELSREKILKLTDILNVL